MGGIFENSKISIRKSFLAIYLHTAHKKDLSIIQLARYVKTMQATAWFMLQRLREVTKSEYSTFQGATEIGEAYIGGKEGNMHKTKKANVDKAIIIGIINRKTKQAKTLKYLQARKNGYCQRLNT